MLQHFFTLATLVLSAYSAQKYATLKHQTTQGTSPTNDNKYYPIKMIDLYPDFTAHIHFFSEAVVPYASVNIDSDPGYVRKEATQFGKLVSCSFYTDDVSLNSLSAEASIRNANFITIYFTADGEDYGIFVSNVPDISTRTPKYTRILVHNRRAHPLLSTPTDTHPAAKPTQTTEHNTPLRSPVPSKSPFVNRRNHSFKSQTPHRRHSVHASPSSHRQSTDSYFRRRQNNRGSKQQPRSRSQMSFGRTPTIDHSAEHPRLNNRNPTQSRYNSMPQVHDYRSYQDEEILPNNRQSRKSMSRETTSELTLSSTDDSLWLSHDIPLEKNTAQYGQPVRSVGIHQVLKLAEPNKSEKKLFGFFSRRSKPGEPNQPKIGKTSRRWSMLPSRRKKTAVSAEGAYTVPPAKPPRAYQCDDPQVTTVTNLAEQMPVTNIDNQKPDTNLVDKKPSTKQVDQKPGKMQSIFSSMRRKISRKIGRNLGKQHPTQAEAPQNNPQHTVNLVSYRDLPDTGDLLQSPAQPAIHMSASTSPPDGIPDTDLEGQTSSI